MDSLKIFIGVLSAALLIFTVIRWIRREARMHRKAEEFRDQLEDIDRRLGTAKAGLGAVEKRADALQADVGPDYLVLHLNSDNVLVSKVRSFSSVEAAQRFVQRFRTKGDEQLVVVTHDWTKEDVYRDLGGNEVEFYHSYR